MNLDMLYIMDKYTYILGNIQISTKFLSTIKIVWNLFLKDNTLKKSISRIIALFLNVWSNYRELVLGRGWSWVVVSKLWLVVGGRGWLWVVAPFSNAHLIYIVLE